MNVKTGDLSRFLLRLIFDTGRFDILQPHPRPTWRGNKDPKIVGRKTLGGRSLGSKARFPDTCIYQPT